MYSGTKCALHKGSGPRAPKRMLSSLHFAWEYLNPSTVWLEGRDAIFLLSKTHVKQMWKARRKMIKSLYVSRKCRPLWCQELDVMAELFNPVFISCLFLWKLNADLGTWMPQIKTAFPGLPYPQELWYGHLLVTWFTQNYPAATSGSSSKRQLVNVPLPSSSSISPSFQEHAQHSGPPGGDELEEPESLNIGPRPSLKKQRKKEKLSYIFFC